MNADEVAKILDELGQRLGPAGEHVYGVLVKQAVVMSTVWVWVTGILLVLSLVGLAFAWFGAYRYWWKASDAGATTFFVIFVDLAVLFGLVTSLITLNNPEYQAITDLLTRLNPAS